MSPSLRGRPIRAALILLALTLCGFATSATAHAKQLKSERLVVRGGATVQLRLPDHFDNGEGGLCAPVTGQIVLGRGTPDRLTLALAGDSCQDGNGPPPTASFTGLATWIVVKGTGKYAHARGIGTGTFLEDAEDRERVTLIGRIAR